MCKLQYEWEIVLPHHSGIQKIAATTMSAVATPSAM